MEDEVEEQRQVDPANHCHVGSSRLQPARRVCATAAGQIDEHDGLIAANQLVDAFLQRLGGQPDVVDRIESLVRAGDPGDRIEQALSHPTVTDQYALHLFTHNLLRDTRAPGP